MLQVLHDPVMDVLNADFFADFFCLAADRLEEKRHALCALDGAIGDGDHGSSMAGGFAAITRALRQQNPTSAAEVMRIAAQAFLSEVGATVGPLYASGFLEAGRRLQGAEPLGPGQFGLFLAGCAEGIQQRGQAAPGDKTMLDVWLPAAQAAQRAASAGAGPAEIARLTAATARSACENTAALISLRGRAARLQDRSIGHIDPGAASGAVVIEALCDTVLSRLRHAGST
ncbi:MAG: dihydroxyacetone kinase subunit L [Roseinatronobacter sp.]|jgi:dihydroxyacetone kinase-like protein|nr:dihydroxyacetone kinase subunit L [Roseinatronobacter sp.]